MIRVWDRIHVENREWYELFGLAIHQATLPHLGLAWLAIILATARLSTYSSSLLGIIVVRDI
jgi:hypothetical protein